MVKPTKKKALLIYLSIIGVTLFLCVSAVYFLQPSMFFHPYHDAEAYQTLQQTDDFQEIIIPHKDGHLHGWLHRDSEIDIAPLVILYGGNGQNSSAWFRFFENANTFRWFSGYHVLFVDYPGYGLSDGKPTENALFAAALKVFDFAQSLDGVNGQVVLLGYSIGTGVATYVASQREINGLILLAPYDRGLSLYNDVCNIFHGPLKLLARFKFDSATYAERITVAPLILASRNDKVIPYIHAVELGNHFQTVDEFILLDGVDHDGFFFSHQVLEAIHTYLKEIQSP